jgi:hypothetical protein
MKIFFIIIILVQTSCTTIDAAKEVSKATNSIKKSIDNIIGSIEKDKESLNIEKEKEKKLVVEQKKIMKINFLEKTLPNIKLIIGEPNLIRKDGNTVITRFDTNNCRLFLILDSRDNYKKIQHFEIRDTKGNLTINKNELQNCYKDLRLS